MRPLVERWCIIDAVVYRSIAFTEAMCDVSTEAMCDDTSLIASEFQMSALKHLLPVTATDVSHTYTHTHAHAHARAHTPRAGFGAMPVPAR